MYTYLCCLLHYRLSHEEVNTLLGQHGLVLVRQFAQFLVARPHGHTPLGGVAVQQLLTNLQDVACLLGLYCVVMCVEKICPGGGAANQYSQKKFSVFIGGVGGGGGQCPPPSPEYAPPLSW